MVMNKHMFEKVKQSSHAGGLQGVFLLKNLKNFQEMLKWNPHSNDRFCTMSWFHTGFHQPTKLSKNLNTSCYISLSAKNKSFAFSTWIITAWNITKCGSLLLLCQAWGGTRRKQTLCQQHGQGQCRTHSENPQMLRRSHSSLHFHQALLEDWKAYSNLSCFWSIFTQADRNLSVCKVLNLLGRQR